MHGRMNADAIQAIIEARRETERAVAERDAMKARRRAMFRDLAYGLAFAAVVTAIYFWFT